MVHYVGYGKPEWCAPVQEIKEMTKEALRCEAAKDSLIELIDEANK